MKITFVLPGSGQQPVGGLKVVYEYANGLAEEGHKVTVVHAPYRRFGEISGGRQMRCGAVYLARRLGWGGGFRPEAWFRCSPRVRLLWVPSLHPRRLPPADAVFATAWETAEWVAAYPPTLGKKYYLIQHLESHFRNTEEQRVLATWKLPLTKIVIARWLLETAHALGEEAQYLPNGLDFEAFGLDRAIAERNPKSLLMLYHTEEWKGSNVGLQAINLAKERVPNLRATLFGLPPRPPDLPAWIGYHRNPYPKELRQLYNDAAIFVGPSLAEGWPLPPAEAAQCGAALCLTDIGGHREYARQGETALLSPPGDAEAMAENILRLVEQPELRLSLAQNAHNFIQQFTWQRAVTSILEVLRRPAAN